MVVVVAVAVVMVVVVVVVEVVVTMTIGGSLHPPEVCGGVEVGARLCMFTCN